MSKIYEKKLCTKLELLAKANDVNSKGKAISCHTLMVVHR